MRKFFTFLVGSVACLAVSAQDIKLEYTVEPAPGEVTELTRVVLKPAGQIDELEVSDREAITVTFNGEALVLGTDYKIPFSSDVEIVFAEPQTAAGTYVVTMPEYSFCGYKFLEDDALMAANEETVVLTYTIGGATPPVAAEDYVIAPVPGEVTEVSFATVTFDASRWAEAEILSADDIYVTYNGMPVEGTKATYSGTEVKIALPEAATKPGNYTFTIPALTLCLYDAEYNSTDYGKLIEFTYTIAGSAQEAPKFTANPAEGEVTELGTIALEFDKESYAEVEVNDSEAINVKKDGETVAASVKVVDETVLNVVLAEKATAPGIYVVTIPAGSICLWGPEYADMTDTAEDIVLTYEIKEAAPAVVYDVEITKTKPAVGDIDMDVIQFESIIVYMPEGIKPSETATATFAAIDGSYSETSKLKYNWGTQAIVFLPAPEANGEYTLTIPKGSIGDEAWLANPETGRSNEEIVLHYNVIGLPEKTAVVYDIAPVEIAPAPEATVSELTTVTLKFASDVKMKEGAMAYVSCIEARYSVEEDIVAKGDGVFEITLSKPVTESGTYDLFIYRGSFGDADYVADNNTGHASSDVEAIWTVVVSPTVGIDGIEAEVIDVTDGVYNLNGVRVADSVEGLAPGIYVAGGKKFMVK